MAATLRGCRTSTATASGAVGRVHSPTGSTCSHRSKHHHRKVSEKSAISKAAEKKLSAEIPNYGWILGGSLCLCFNAGYVNALTLNTHFHAPSAHVTGMVAQTSHYAATGDSGQFGQFAVSYLCFLMGAFTSGGVVQHEAFYLGRMYGRVLFLLAAIWGVALIIESHFDNTIYFVWACAFSCGLQNGLTSKYSGNALRTTHLTGTTTDLGIALAHIFLLKKNEWWKVQVHLCAISGFFLGGIGGQFAFQRYEHLALLLSICLSSFCGLLHTAYLSYHEAIPFFAVIQRKEDIYLHRERVRSPTSHARVGSLNSLQSICLSDGVSPTNELVPNQGKNVPQKNWFRSRLPSTDNVRRLFRADSSAPNGREPVHLVQEAAEEEQKGYADSESQNGDEDGRLMDETDDILPPPEAIPEQEFDDDDVAARALEGIEEEEEGDEECNCACDEEEGPGRRLDPEQSRNTLIGQRSNLTSL